MNHIETQLDQVLAWYGHLAPDNLSQIAQFYRRDARFKDPFNDVSGVAAIEAVFAHMFATTENPRFIIENRIVQQQQAFAVWRFEFGLKGKPYTICGGSHLVFDEAGLIILHRDYWDAAEELLQKLPIVGAPIRWLRRQFTVKVGC
jgi:hypothetical protein